MPGISHTDGVHSPPSAPRLQEAPMPLDDEVDARVQQRMARANELCHGLVAGVDPGVRPGEVAAVHARQAVVGEVFILPAGRVVLALLAVGAAVVAVVVMRAVGTGTVVLPELTRDADNPIAAINACPKRLASPLFLPIVPAPRT